MSTLLLTDKREDNLIGVYVTTIPFSVSYRIPFETYTVDTRDLLKIYRPALKFIEKTLDNDISTVIEEALEQPHTPPTLEFWNQKLKEFNKPKSVINDFLFVKVLEISAFYQGHKEGTRTLRENETSGRKIKSSSITNDCGLTNQEAQDRNLGFCFVIPIHLRDTIALRFFRRMISSIFSQKLLPSRSIVIDDCSPVKIDRFTSNHCSISIFRSNNRYGPAYSRNLGAKIACEENYDIIAFLDYDVVLPKLWTKRVDDHLEQLKGDIISGINCSYCTTWWDWYHDVNGTLNGRAFLNSQYLLYATTAALVVRSTVLEKIHFNEIFHDAAGEDIDFCFRANQHHFKIYLAKNLIARHDYGYTGNLTDDLNLFLTRFTRYGSAEPLLSSLHPEYHSQFYSSIGLSIHSSISQKTLPKFPFR